MRTPNSSKFTRLATISTLGAMMFGAGFVASSPAVASDTQNAYYDHHIECVGLLLSDADAHAASCLPSRIVPSLGSPSKTGASEEKCVTHKKGKKRKGRKHGGGSVQAFTTVVVVEEGPSYNHCRPAKKHKSEKRRPRRDVD